jgi:hypothetical protein
MKINVNYLLQLTVALLICSFESKAQTPPVKTKADSARVSPYAKVMYGNNDNSKPLAKQIAKTTIVSYKGTPGANNNATSIHPTPIAPTTAQPAIIGPKGNQHVINNGQIYKKQ